MDEIVVRPKYSRQTGVQRKKRRESEKDLLSTAFAAKLLVVVVFLSVFALCKAADTPTTEFLISKVEVITTRNFDANKYIFNFATAIGIKLPQKIDLSENNIDEKGINSELNNDTKIIEKNGEVIQDTQNLNKVSENDNITDIGENTGRIQSLEDTEIKAIADKYAFITPIKGNIVAAFGTYTLSGDSEFHDGIDIEANMGTSIKAALGGEVVEVGTTPKYGNYIKIKHNDGIDSVYAHCSILISKEGDKVNQGDVIAKVGDTEGLSGSHLHFEVWKDNKAVDPEKLLNYLNQ